MTEIKPPNQTLKEILTEAISPIHQRLDNLEENLNNRLENLELNLNTRLTNLELSHQYLKQGLEDFLTELTDLLNKKKSSDLKEVLQSLTDTLKTVSHQLEEQQALERQLNVSMEQLQNMLDNNIHNNN